MDYLLLHHRNDENFNRAVSDSSDRSLGFVHVDEVNADEQYDQGPTLHCASDSPRRFIIPNQPIRPKSHSIYALPCIMIKRDEYFGQRQACERKICGAARQRNVP
jgi:hypothetical protein